MTSIRIKVTIFLKNIPPSHPFSLCPMYMGALWGTGRCFFLRQKKLLWESIQVKGHRWSLVFFPIKKRMQKRKESGHSVTTELLDSLLMVAREEGGRKKEKLEGGVEKQVLTWMVSNRHKLSPGWSGGIFHRWTGWYIGSSFLNQSH